MVDGYASGLAKTALIESKPFMFNPFWPRRERNRQSEDATGAPCGSNKRPAGRCSQLSLGSVNHRGSSRRPQLLPRSPCFVITDCGRALRGFPEDSDIHESDTLHAFLYA